MAMSERLNLGASIQNVGSQITYLSEGDDLPEKVLDGSDLLVNSR